MSILSRTESDIRAHGRIDAAAVTDYTGQTARILTDGVNLYRSLGAIAGGMGQMVGLENCRSSDVMLLPIGELRTRALRAVIPADDGRAGGDRGSPQAACGQVQI
jgi:hypothetical protein